MGVNLRQYECIYVTEPNNKQLKNDPMTHTKSRNRKCSRAMALFDRLQQLVDVTCLNIQHYQLATNFAIALHMLGDRCVTFGVRKAFSEPPIKFCLQADYDQA